jgi:hypothetical protein
MLQGLQLEDQADPAQAEIRAFNFHYGSSPDVGPDQPVSAGDTLAVNGWIRNFSHWDGIHKL